MSSAPPPSPDQLSENSGLLHEQLYRYAEDLQQMMERHLELENNYQQLIKISNDMHLITDRDGIVLESNPAAWKIAGRHQLKGSNLKSWVQETDVEQFKALLTCAGQGGAATACNGYLRIRTSDASAMLVSAQLVSEQSEAKQLHWLLQEMTQLAEAFDPARDSMVLRNAVEGVMVTDHNGQILAVNPAFSQITGYSETECIGQNTRLLSSGRQDQHFYSQFWQTLRDKGNWKGELYNKRKNGEVYLQHLSISAVCDGAGRVLSYISILFDQSQTEKRHAHLAHHDALTGLANRVLLEERIGQQLSQARRSAGKFTLIFIDLDKFKQINDMLGHAVGDGVLREAANRLTSAVRESDTVARLGGDEFVILATDLAGDDDIRMLCHKTIMALCKPMRIDGHEVYIGSSLGCAEYPRHGADQASLMRHADQAMYQAKSAGGNICVISRVDIEPLSAGVFSANGSEV